jgi:hypothetical protein
MFRNILDAFLDYKATHVISVLVQSAILIWALALRGGIKPILVVNFIIASAVVLYNATQLPAAIQYQDHGLLGLVLFEAVTLATAAAALCGVRISVFLVWIAFAVNFFLCIALMLFMLTFKMTRLI